MSITPSDATRRRDLRSFRWQKIDGWPFKHFDCCCAWMLSSARRARTGIRTDSGGLCTCGQELLPAYADDAQV